MGLDKDRETINIIREMMPDVPICVDVNQGWTGKITLHDRPGLGIIPIAGK